MTETETVGDSAWLLSEAEIAALHEKHRPQVEAAMQRLPQGLSLPLFTDESFEAQLNQVILYGMIAGLLLAYGVQPEAAVRWLAIDLAAKLLDHHDRLQAADRIGPVAGHA
jgi:hypothetical protein